MLLDDKVVLKWNSKIKAHYLELGYTFTKMNDEFEVSVDDLTDGSNIEFNIRCDYCGKIYKKRWANYIKENRNSEIHTDCCNDCKKYKIQDVTNHRYGVNTVLKLDSIKKKISETNLKKYGVTNPFKSDEVKGKIIQTNLNRYGVSNPLKNKAILQKVSDTCEKKYGVKYYVMTQRFSGESSPRWKGGVARQRSERFTYDYIVWRKNVFDRDLYTCQCCKRKNHKGNNDTVYLNAHHIFNWKDNPNLRFNIDNGITLCTDCHNKFHSKYGKTNTTDIQLNEFLINYGKKIC